jgi:hypothetical protein
MEVLTICPVQKGCNELQDLKLFGIRTIKSEEV